MKLNNLEKMKNKAFTWLWDIWYIRFLYIPNENIGVYREYYISLRAKNKRHARKVLFKFIKSYINKGEVKTICRIRIYKSQFLPTHFLDDYDGPRHFWANQSSIL